MDLATYLSIHSLTSLSTVLVGGQLLSPLLVIKIQNSMGLGGNGLSSYLSSSPLKELIENLKTGLLETAFVRVKESDEH